MNGAVNKKLIIIVSVIVVLFIAIALFLRSQNVSQEQQPSTPSQTTAANSDSSTNTTSMNTTAANKLTAYHNSSYSFSYPKEWNTTEQALADTSGSIVKLLPPTANQNDYKNITVEQLDANVSSIDTFASMFRGFHETETNTVVAGVAAQKYEGTAPTDEGTQHEIDYLLQKDGKIYLLKLIYVNPMKDSQLEEQFNQMVHSFSA